MGIAQNRDVATTASPRNEALLSHSFEPQTLDELLTATPAQIAACDIARMNLACAVGLPGSEDLDINRCLKRLRYMTEYIAKKTQQELPYFRSNPEAFGMRLGTSEAIFRIAVLVGIMKGKFGLHYHRETIELQQNQTGETIAHLNSKRIFINGLLGDERDGMCASIPVVIVAIGRRLGYPLYLTGRRNHYLARWEDDGQRFNIEASCDGTQFQENQDEYYLAWPFPLREVDKRAGRFLENFTPADELAFCLGNRAGLLEDHLRFEEAIPYWLRATQLAPHWPRYATRGATAVTEAIYLRQKGRPITWTGPRRAKRRPKEDIGDCNLNDLFPPKTAAQMQSLWGRCHEARGEMGIALRHYRAACDAEPDNLDYQADYDRYRQRLHQEIVAAQVQSLASTRREYPNATIPTLEEVVKSVEQSLTHPLPEGVLPPDSCGTANVRQQEYRALQAMDAGRWSEAQAGFAIAYSSAPDEEKHIFRAYLGSAIRKELLGIAPLKPEPPRVEVDDDGDEEDENPFPNLHPHLRGFVWNMRGAVLASLDRFAEAEQAFADAAKLSPGNEEYPKLQKQMAELEAQQKARTQPKSALTWTGNQLPYPDLYVTTPEAAFSIRDGSALPPVMIPPCQLPIAPR